MNSDNPTGQAQQTSPPLERTRDGQLLTVNRQAREALRPWVAHVYGLRVDAPEDQLISCGIFSDGPVVRVLLWGDYHLETRDGPQFYRTGGLYFGPHRRRLPVTIRGPFASVGVAFKPGAVEALGLTPPTQMMDRVVPCAQAGWDEQAILANLDPEAGVDEWMGQLQDYVAIAVDRAGGRLPDPLPEAFNRLAFVDPTLPVADCADELGVELRTLERRIKRAFGLSPKKVLRRARALDMAAHMRGVADHNEAEELALRYFDQSHLNREFTELFGMTPVQFVRTPQPILTTTLEARQARRLEVLERLPEGARRPWHQTA
jgi:AraC-like DNA-binding protein